jgi:hypothetical protein
MTTTTSKASKVTLLTRVQALIAGTQKHYPNGSFSLLNTAYTTATLVQLLQSLADALTALNTAEASVKDAVLAVTAARAKVVPVILAYTRQLRTTFGGATQTLLDFGVEPDKVPAPRTSEQKAEAAAKARATREARGTTSKKQKATIKGNVTGIVVTPVTSPAAAPATPAAPVVAPQPVSNASATPPAVPAAATPKS